MQPIFSTVRSRPVTPTTPTNWYGTHVSVPALSHHTNLVFQLHSPSLRPHLHHRPTPNIASLPQCTPTVHLKLDLSILLAFARRCTFCFLPSPGPHVLHVEMSCASVLVVLVSLLSLSLLPTSLADSDCSCARGEYNCNCGTCNCDNNGYGYCSGDCGWGGGTVAGVVIACIVGVGIILCLLSLCYRRRYYNYGGRTTYGTGTTATIVNTGVPMQAQPVGGYGSPMQAIPVQYAQQYPAGGSQPAYNPYGATYAQNPVGAGQPITDPSLPASQPPAYTAYPSAPANDITYPSKPSQYEGERAI